MATQVAQAAQVFKICKMKECAIQFQIAGFRERCYVTPAGKLLCDQAQIIPETPENKLFCVGENAEQEARNNCDKSVPLKGCYTGGGGAGALVAAPDQCPELATASFATITTTSTTTTSKTSSTFTTTSSVSTSISGFISTNATSSASDSPAPTLLPPLTNPSPVSKGGMSTGAVAGIAIGAAVAGVAIAGLIFLFLLQRYRKRSQTAYDQPPLFNGELPNEKSSSAVGTTAIAPVDTYLPQPAEDDAISGEMSRLRDKIKNHVQSFYVTSAVNPNSVDQNKLVDLATATGLPPGKLQDMFLNPHSRMTAIRLYLAWFILSRCGTQRTAGPSFLPGEVAAFAAALSVDDTTGRNNGKLVLSTKWKAISGELLQSKYGHQALNNSSIEQSISQAMADADLVLLPFVNASLEARSDKRLRNLEVIMRRAAQFAFLLFTQPSLFTFEWAAQKGGIVVFPGLYQIVDEDGNLCQPPRAFSDSEVVGA